MPKDDIVFVSPGRQPLQKRDLTARATPSAVTCEDDRLEVSALDS